METYSALLSAVALAPVLLMFLGVIWPFTVHRLVRCRPWVSGDLKGQGHQPLLWRGFLLLSVMALLSAIATLGLQYLVLSPGKSVHVLDTSSLLGLARIGAWMAVLVQFLGTVIGSFSSRYLHGEKGQTSYAAALSAVLAAVHLLLMANHWLVLMLAWSLIAIVLERLLCFYPERPFAVLAAHKKFIADRLADVLLLVAAYLSWREVGSGSFSDLWQHLSRTIPSLALQVSAVLLVLAVILRTALLPVHGWLIQVMEAPTPVSALLHAGVVNLGGFVLIRFAPLLEAVPAARWILVLCGLGTAMLAGLVMLTRISIKVKLAWSTVTQMGFMVLECGLGLYTLAALHLLGHSLYKAHSFLSASGAVRQSKLGDMRGSFAPSAFSVMAMPALALAIVLLVQVAAKGNVWPWWWSGVLAFAWAPLLWMPRAAAKLPPVGHQDTGVRLERVGAGVLIAAVLTAVACVLHHLPLGVQDRPDAASGVVALAGMAAVYVCVGALQLCPRILSPLRRWSYAGFYLDEIYTRITLQLWPRSLWPAHLWARKEAAPAFHVSPNPACGTPPPSSPATSAATSAAISGTSSA